MTRSTCKLTDPTGNLTIRVLIADRVANVARKGRQTAVVCSQSQAGVALPPAVEIRRGGKAHDDLEKLVGEGETWKRGVDKDGLVRRPEHLCMS